MRNADTQTSGGFVLHPSFLLGFIFVLIFFFCLPASCIGTSLHAASMLTQLDMVARVRRKAREEVDIHPPCVGCAKHHGAVRVAAIPFEIGV